MRTLRRWGAVVALTAAAVFSVLAVSGTASADTGGNSAAAHACQDGGYANLEGTDGTLFSNVGNCVSYAAHGGTLVAIAPSVSVAVTPTSDPNYCNVIVTLSRFAPNTTYPSTFTINRMGPYPGPNLTTDANGNLTTDVFSFNFSFDQNNSIIYTVNGVSSPETLITCLT